MKKFQKRSLAWLASLMLFISLFASLIVLPAEAATVDYVYSGNYVYNWGQRDEPATFLSPMAEDFYDENGVTYQQLASYSGSSTVSSVPYSALFSQLHELMYGNLDNPTSYDATRDQFKYTDCENSGGSISSFYSGKAIGPAWDSGKTWNREHVWPNSKSNGKSDTNTQRETDIMMLRPASVSENSSRSNTAYGESAKFYDPNELGQNVRGDAARIVLYVYVCWGGSDKHDGALDYMWGSSGVMESKDVLLKWIEEDPVDTWELGRNDAVEAITGTRNVFVDYPELAFLLFGEEVPDDYDSPSGEQTPSVIHDYKATVTVAPTCDKAGVRTYTCTECGDSYTEAIPATGHKMANGVCSVCGIQKQSVTFTLGANGNASHQDGTSNTTYTETVDGYTLNIVSGVKMHTGAIDAKGNGCIKLGTSSAVGGFSFTVPNEVSSVVIHIAKYKVNATKIHVNDVEHTINGSSNDGQYDAIEVDTSVNKTVSLTTLSGGVRAMMNTIDYIVAQACDHAYTSHVTTAATCGADGVMTYTCSICNSSYTEAIPATGDHTYDNVCDAACNVCGTTRTPANHAYTSQVTTDATCGADGVKTFICSVCGDNYTEAIPATGEHTYDHACDADCNACGTVRTPSDHVYTAACDTICDVCGAVRTITAGGETTITFDADKTQRIEFSTATQVWQNGDLIVTNNKGSASSNVADYSDPVRFYKGSQIIITYPGMTSLIINAPTGTYGTPWEDTLKNAGLTPTVNGGVYTVTFDAPVDSITLTASAQIRANSITAVGNVNIEHDYQAVVTDPDCVNGGYTTYTCPVCGDSYVDDEIDALGHKYTNACDSDCNVCGAVREVGDHVYDNANDTTCNECGAVRQIAAQVLSGGQTSVSEDCNGLAFFFTANVSGAQAQNGYEYVTNSASVIPFVDGESYSVVRMGAIVSNGVSSVDIEAKYLWDVAADTASFAVRLINIPDDQLNREITALPYYVYEVDGEEIVVYGDAVSKSYNAAAQ